MRYTATTTIFSFCLASLLFWSYCRFSPVTKRMFGDGIGGDAFRVDWLCQNTERNSKPQCSCV